MPFIITTQTPPSVAPSENPILFKVRTPSVSNSDLANAKFSISINTSPITAGDYITFYFTNPSFTTKKFIATSYPTAANEFYASTVTSPTDGTNNSVTRSQIVANLADKLRSDPFIALYYSINVDDETIYMVAKTAGDGFTLTPTVTDAPELYNAVYSSDANIDLVEISEGYSPIQGENIKNYSLYCDVYLPDNLDNILKRGGSLYNSTLIGSLRKPFLKDGSNNVEFDLSTLLKNYTSTAIPDLTISNISKPVGGDSRERPIVPYLIEYGEYSPVSDTSDGLLMSKTPKGIIDNKHAINAALPYGDGFDDYYITNQSTPKDPKFLTSSPEKKLSHPALQYDGLYFVYNRNNNDNSITFKPEVVFSYYDGTNQTVDLFQNTFDGVGTFSNEEFSDGLTGWNQDAIAGTDVAFAPSTVTFSNGVRAGNGTTDIRTQVLYQSVTPPEYSEVNASVRVRNFSSATAVRLQLMGYDGTWDVIAEKVVSTSTTQTLDFKSVSVGSNNYTRIGVRGLYFANNSVGLDIDYARFDLSYTETINGVYSFNAAPSNIGINTDGIYNSKRVKDYTVTIRDIDNQFDTQSKTYYLPYDIAPKGQTVVWQNPLGGYDSHYFTGIREDAVNRSSDTFERVVDKNFPSGFAKNKEYNIEATDTVAINSGWLKEDHMDWIKQILSSPKIYLVNADGILDYYTLGGYNYNKNNQNNQFSLELTLVRTIENNNITE